VRREFPDRIKVARFQLCAGRCEGFVDGKPCNALLAPGKWECDHHDPDAMTGSPTVDNARCLCLPCHRAKTKADVGRIAKAKRNEAHHIGVPRRSKMAGSKGSGWKKKLDGTTERRT